MRIEIPYGTTSSYVEIDESRIADVIRPRDVDAGDEGDVLTRALESPLGAPCLRDFLGGPGRTVVIVNDATRSTPTARVLSAIAEELRASGDLEFIVATGTHKPPTPEELVLIFGDSYVAVEKSVIIHDSTDEARMVSIGSDAEGREIRIARRVAEADRIVIVGSVEPHYFAGFTGGRKSILPGVASYETIERNHAHALDDGVGPTLLSGNPVHEGMARAARLVGRDRIFAIMTVLDRRGRLCGASCGDVEMSFEASVEKARGVFCVDVEGLSEIVVAVATSPLDRDLYQSHKALESGKLALKDGGVIVLVSECREGIGYDAFVKTLASSDSPAEVLDLVGRNFRLGQHKAARIAETAARAEIWAVTSVDDSTLESMFFRPFPTVQDALDEALTLKGPGARVLFLMDASTTVPRLRRG